MIYYGLVALLGLSLAVLFLPEWIVSNKDALIGFGVTGAMFVVVKYVDASAGIMGWVIPVCVVGAVGYLGYRYFAGKTPTLINK